MKKKKYKPTKNNKNQFQAGKYDPNLVPKNKEDWSLVSYDPLQMYLWEIRKYKVLTKDEEIELAIRYREKKDKSAAHKLIVSNLKLVVKIAMDFHRYWMKNLMDLVQEGILD